MVKVPRFAFEKFPAADSTLTTHMKSVGEAMAIGRNFTEALGKALRSLEDPKAPFNFSAPIPDLEPGSVGDHSAGSEAVVAELLERAARPHDGRLGVVMQALRAGATPERVHDATKIDPWFLDQLVLLLEVAETIKDAPELTAECSGWPSGTASPTLRSRPSVTSVKRSCAVSMGARDPSGLQ